MEIFFCEKCGKRISDAEIENGYAVKVGSFVYCRKCAPSQDAGVRSGAEKRGRKTTPVRTSTGRTDHAGTGSRPVTPASKYAIIGVVLVVVFVVVGILLFRTPEKPADLPPLPKPVKAQQNIQLPPMPETPVVSQTQATVVPAPVSKPADTAVVAPTPAPTASPNEELLYAWDPKSGELGWDGGRRVEDASRLAGVYENTKPDGSLTNRVTLSSYAMKLPDRAFFTGSKDVFVSLEYFVTGGNGPVNFTVTIWDDKNKKNCYHVEQSVAKDRWNSLRLAASKDFIPVGNDHGRTPEDAVVRDLKLLVGPENQGVKLRVSGIRFTRLNAEPAKQTREAAAFEADFEQDANGWSAGERESGNVPEGSKWAYRAVPPAKDEFRSEEVCAQAQDFRPERRNLFVAGENTSVSFDYFIDNVDEPEGLVVMIRNFTKRNNPRRYMNVPVQGKWAHLTLPLKDLIREGTPPVPGDVVTEFFIQVQSSRKDMVLIVDNVRFIKEVPEPGR